MYKYFSLVLIVFALVACKTTQSVSTDSNSANEQSKDYYVLKRGECVDLSFITNASLGMAWYWKNSDEVTIVDSTNISYHQENPKLIGSSSTMLWTFCGNTKGTDTLLFQYCPVYDQKNASKERKVVIFVR